MDGSRGVCRVKKGDDVTWDRMGWDEWNRIEWTGGQALTDIHIVSSDGLQCRGINSECVRNGVCVAVSH